MSRIDRDGATTPTPRTPTRTPHRTPHRTITTPHRTPTRTPTKQRSFINSKTTLRPTPPDFAAMAGNDTIVRKSVLGKRNDDSFIAYNPEKEPIKVKYIIFGEVY